MPVALIVNDAPSVALSAYVMLVPVLSLVVVKRLTNVFVEPCPLPVLTDTTWSPTKSATGGENEICQLERDVAVPLLINTFTVNVVPEYDTTGPAQYSLPPDV